MDMPVQCAREVGPLRSNHDFQLMVFGRTLALLGGSMTSLALSLLAYDLSGSASTAAAIVSANFVGGLVTAIPAGALVDRWNRKDVMVVTTALLSAFLFSIPIAALLGSLTMWHLGVVSAAVGVLGTFYGPAETASIKRVVPAEQLGQAMSVNSARWAVSNMLGGPLAGLLYSLGHTIPLIGDAVANLVAAVCASRLRTDLAPVEREPTTLWRDVFEGFGWLVHHPTARTVAVVSCAGNFATWTLITAVTLGLRQEGHAASIVGLTQLASGITIFLGSMVTPWFQRRARIGTLYLLGTLLMLVTIPALQFGNPVVTLVCYGVGAFAGPVANIGVQSWFVTATPDQLQGRAQVAINTLSTGLIPVANMLAGYLLDHGGRPMALVPAILAFTVAGAAASMSAIRQLPKASQLNHAD